VFPKTLFWNFLTGTGQPNQQSELSLDFALTGQMIMRTVQSRQQQPSDFALTYPAAWLQSGKNLDLCLLAVCSCVLTLLCHQTSISHTSSGAIRTAPTTASIDFAVKAGLFTSSKSEDPEQAPEL
jgi:hypothetical protein